MIICMTNICMYANYVVPLHAYYVKMCILWNL